MTVRRAAPEETQAVISFYYDLIDEMKDDPFRPTWFKGVYPLPSDLSEAADNGWLWIAVGEDGSIVGAVVVNNRQGEGYADVNWNVTTDAVAVVHLLGTSPRLHGRGIGRKLLESARDAAKETGAEVIRLDTLPHNAPGRHLYESFGFRYCGNIELYYPSTGVTPFSMYEYVL